MTSGNTLFRYAGFRRALCAALGLAFFVASDSGTAHAQGSPGPLTRSHAKYDSSTDCQLCHNGAKALDENKCLNCHFHNDLRSRIRAEMPSASDEPINQSVASNFFAATSCKIQISTNPDTISKPDKNKVDQTVNFVRNEKGIY